jgi:hypothetical protein
MLKYSPTTDDGRNRLGYFYIFISDYKNDTPPPPAESIGCPWGNRNRTNKSQNLKSSLELTYRMYKLCKLLLADDRDFRPQTCTNGLVFRECKHIKNMFEDVYFTKNLSFDLLTI